MRIRLTLLALLAGLLVASGCTAGGSSREAPAQGPAKPGPANLSFTAETLDGKPFDGASLAGHPAVLWFWAPWCGTCAGQGPTVAEIANKYSGKVTVVGVAGLGELDAMREFVSDTGVGGIAHLADRSGTVWKRFGITEQSQYVLLDRGGKVVHKGWLDSEQFADAVAKLAG